MFPEAYRAEAMDFKVNVLSYSLHAWLDWRFNFEDPMQIQSAPLVPEPICNHCDLVPNDMDPDHLDSSNVQLIEVPEDNLLGHPPALAVVDGAPGFQSALAPLSAVPSVSAHIGGLASACNFSVPHVVVPDD